VRITLIGGTRFIGAACAERLVARGHEVTVVHRGRHRCELDGVVDLIADRNHPQQLIAALRKAQPEVVIDTRAMTKSQAEVTAMALKILSVPAVVLSSIDVYAQFGSLNGHPCAELREHVDETAPLTVPYPFRGVADHPGGEDYDKKDVEEVFRQACRRELPAATALRLPLVYGRRDYRRRFGGIVDRIDAGETTLPHVGGASFRLSHAHVDNVAQAVALAVEGLEAGFRLFNVAERETPTMCERAEAIAGAMGIALGWREVQRLPDDLGHLGQEPNDFVADSSAIRRALGFEEIVDEREAVDDLVDWLRRSRDVTLH
jgi:nucleoside-diphosphate-sugar epimerase